MLNISGICEGFVLDHIQAGMSLQIRKEKYIVANTVKKNIAESNLKILWHIFQCI